ncbi:MAG: mechanosensitive ion channel [Proteobacteria bacterium]|jgi:small conductance mechanosensitive channel|nr:mechanosensitive ion channel [Pseudomonadota bacterium]
MEQLNIEKLFDAEFIDMIIQSAIQWVTTYSFSILGAIIIFFVGRWLSGRITSLLTKLLKKNKVDAALTGFLSNLSYYALMVVVVIAAVGQLGINTTSFLTIVGAAGLAIGLALKDSLNNFASGVMIILFRPFGIGDVITAGGVTGKVQSIAIFNTIMTTGDNQRVIVPNGNIINSVITNITANDTRRIDLVVGIGYGDDIIKTKQVLADIVSADDRIMSEPAPVIAVSELADSSVNLIVRPWVKTSEYWDVYFDLMEKIKQTFDAEGISIPYPQRDVHLIQEQAGVE